MSVGGSFQLSRILKKIKIARLFGHAFRRLPTQRYLLVMEFDFLVLSGDSRPLLTFALCLSPQILHKHRFQFLLGLTMVPREKKVFSKMTYFLPLRKVRKRRCELSYIQLESVKSGNKVLNDYTSLQPTGMYIDTKYFLEGHEHPLPM